MSTFAFKAVDLAGVPARGEVDAESKQVVADQLRARGLVVLDIVDKAKSKNLNIELFERVKPKDLTVATRQLATMVGSGMTLLRCLYVLESSGESKLLRKTLVLVRKDIEAGLAFSEALRRHPKIFSPLYVAMVEAGETGGFLEQSLLRMADQLEKEDSLRRQVRAAMIYPAVVISFALIIMLALVAFIVPVFAKIFKEFDGKLPGLTKVTVGISNAVTKQGWLWAIIVVLLVIAFLKWKKSKSGRAGWDRFRLRVPLKIGEIVQKIALARWSRTLSALVSGGVPIIQALEITGATSGNVVVERAMGDVITSVQRGGTIAAPLRQAPVFPDMVGHMVEVGEETGALDAMLAKIADFYEDEVAAAVKALTSILEPAMIIIVGAIVGFVVISLYLPMFDVYNQIH
jgi:type IV pilus assembly protein PilC